MIDELYKDEFFQIQKLNNQLINSKRALLKSNQQLKQMLAEIRQANDTISLLERDELTGLYRLSAFYREVQKKLTASPEQAFDLIVLDIDQFKRINEISGRKKGDELLQNTAMLLTGLPGAEQGLFSRAFGDTFFIFIPTELCFYATLDKEITSFFRHYPLPVRICHKIGVYTVHNPSVSAEQICDKATLALDMIDPKSDSKVAFYNESLQHNLLLEHQLLDTVQDALHNGEFQLYLQPKVDIGTGEIIGAEALIRWFHSQLGFVPPDKFIPLLERENGIYPVDQFIWEESCKFLNQRKKRGLRKFPVSVNMARGDLYQPDLTDVLKGLLLTYDLEPSDLHLEVLERTYTSDSSAIFSTLETLRKIGFCIEMDDFGIGESSLSMVAEMPIDVLKLDRHFIVSAGNDPRYKSIIHFIINLATSLNMSTIAEGVETQEQADFLLSLGCQYAQGYYYSKPVPAAELLSVK